MANEIDTKAKEIDNKKSVNLNLLGDDSSAPMSGYARIHKQIEWMLACKG